MLIFLCPVNIHWSHGIKLKLKNLNFKKIGIGAYGYIKSYEEILSDYKKGIEIRKLEQTPCTNLTELKPIYEQYFDINKFK